MNAIKSQINNWTMSKTHIMPDNMTIVPFPDMNEPLKIRKKSLNTVIRSPENNYHNSIYYRIRKSYAISGEKKQINCSPGYLLDEMEMINRMTGAGIFILEDDDFMLSGRLRSQWISEFIEGLHKRKLHNKIYWKILYRLEKAETSFDHVIEDIEFLQEIGKKEEVIIHFTKAVSNNGIPIPDVFIHGERLKSMTPLPDHSFADKRMNWLQHFFTLAFQRRDPERNVLADDLEFARLDSLMLGKFYPNRYDVQIYKNGVLRLIQAANQQSIETLSKIVHFMSSCSEIQIIEDWYFVQCMAQKERYAQRLSLIHI